MQHTYTIKEAAALTGLPASTLRYYESIGVIAPVGRGESSKHRVYDESDLDQIMWVACLAATGMSVSDMQSVRRQRSARTERRWRTGRPAHRTASSGWCARAEHHRASPALRRS